METRSWIGKITFPGVSAVIALTLTLLSAAWPSIALATGMYESPMRGADAHHDGAGDRRRQYGGDHYGDQDHHSRHHFRGTPNGIYYIYPYNQYSYGWIYRYYPAPTYPAPTYPAPTYWYYCPSYAEYYPYVGSCPESWVLVPAS